MKENKGGRPEHSLPIEFIKIPGDKGSAIGNDNEEEYLISSIKNAVSAESLLKEYWHLINNKLVENHKEQYQAWFKKFGNFMKGMPAAQPSKVQEKEERPKVDWEMEYWKQFNENDGLKKEIERLKGSIKWFWFDKNQHKEFLGNTDGEKIKEQQRFWEKYLKDNNL